jgi:hypothetical protein
MTLNWRTTEQEVRLMITVSKALEILNGVQAALAVCNGCVHEMLLAILIDTESFKVDVSTWAELRLHWTRNKDWILADGCHAAFDQTEAEGNDTGHLDGTAE